VSPLPLSSKNSPPKTQAPDTLEKVRTIISEQLGTELDAVAADAKFVDLGADSLDTVEIMMALEEQFEITLDEEGAEKISTVQEAADMIQDQMK
jgi:acyl carrier protein